MELGKPYAWADFNATSKQTLTPGRGLRIWALEKVVGSGEVLPSPPPPTTSITKLIWGCRLKDNIIIFILTRPPAGQS